MDKTLIAIGGGEIRNKTTLKIDEYVANLAKKHALDRGLPRANALFVGTASHDSMPYFNSFRKTYTSVFDIKAEVALTVYGEMDKTKIANKFEMADMVYVGGGDTLFMLSKWQEFGLDKMIIEAYNLGKIICGLSAGAICWFDKMYTDFEIMRGQSNEYKIAEGLGLIKGTITPHYNERKVDFSETVIKEKISRAFAVENDAAAVFINGEFVKSLTSGGSVYEVTFDGQAVTEKKL